MPFYSHYVVQPKSGLNFLGMKETLTRIRAAFPLSEADVEKGRQDTETRLAALTRLGAPQEILESYRYPGIYLYLHDESAPDFYIECMVWPLQAIGVSFASAEHEAACRHLLERLASALDYDYELDPDAA